MNNAVDRLTIRLLCAPEARIAGTSLALHHQKASALLYYLAATGRSHTRDHLAALLWSESPDSNARHSLRSSLYHIRQVLQEEAGEALIGDSNRIYLQLNAEGCDVTHFRRLLVEGTEFALAKAVTLYRGPFLQGFTVADAPLFEEWQRFEEIELVQAYLTALQRLASWAEEHQEWSQATSYLQRIVQLDPLAEEMQQRLIRLYLRTGAIGQALRQYNQFETELSHELGLTPLPETQALFSAALASRHGTFMHPQEHSLSSSTSRRTPQAATFLLHLHDLLAPTATPEEMLRLTSALGRVYQSLGQLEEAASWHLEQLELAARIADLPARAAAHFELGELALVTNDYQAAASAARAGLAIELPAEHPQRMALIARGHRLLGAALAMEGSDLPSAERHLQEAVAAHRLTDNRSDLCATLFELGNVAAQRGELRNALEQYQEAARTAELEHAHYFLALAHNNFAYHSLLLGRLKDARQSLSIGTRLAERYEMFGALMHLSSTQGELHLYLGEWHTAMEAFQYSLAQAEELSNLERQAGNRAGLALAERGQGNLKVALTFLEEALALITERGYWHLRTRIQLWLAESLLLSGDLSLAEPHLKAALATAQAHARQLLLIQGERLSAYLLAARGDLPGANVHFSQALERASSLDLSLEIARTQAVWGQALLRFAPPPHDGHALLAEARQAFASHVAQAELQAIEGAVRI